MTKKSGPASDAVVCERSSLPTATMNLLLRFQTASGPRTVIACSVPRQVASEIADVMTATGQYAEFIDRCVPLSISDIVMMRTLATQSEESNVIGLEKKNDRPRRVASLPRLSGSSRARG